MYEVFWIEFFLDIIKTFFKITIWPCYHSHKDYISAKAASQKSHMPHYNREA